MIGKSTLIGIALAGIASVHLYQTSYKVQEKSEELAKLNRQIVAEQEAIQVLRAEWAFLNDPARLERLAATHTALAPTTADRIVTLAELPLKTPAPAPELEDGSQEDAPLLLSSAAPIRKPIENAGSAAPVVLANYGAAPAYGAAR